MCVGFYLIYSCENSECTSVAAGATGTPGDLDKETPRGQICARITSSDTLYNTGIQTTAGDWATTRPAGEQRHDRSRGRKSKRALLKKKILEKIHTRYRHLQPHIYHRNQ